jgi:RNA polymerase sigma-70 factor (ECF subfamily)
MSDEKLMELYQIGDLYAFNVLYQRYEQRIYRYFYRFFPEERCADLLQETFLKVHRSRSRYKTSLPFSKWLFVIACNLAKDEFKRLSRLKEYLDDEQLEDTQTFLVDPETPESIVEHDELWERIRQAILDLPENHREAIIQSKYEGKSYPEIAESMGTSVGAVKQRAYRGLLTLREKLKDLVEPELKEKTKKGFSASMIFKLQGIIKKVLIGGLDAMKISAKVKFVTIGVVAVLMLSGAGVIVWHYQQSAQEASALSIIQAEQQKNLSLIRKNPPIEKVVANKNVNKPIDKQKEDANDAQNIAQTDSLKEGNSQETKISETKVGGTIDPKEKDLAFRAELEARIPVLEEEIRTGMARINSRGDEVMAVWQSGNLDPETVKWINEQNREIQKEWKDLYLNKIWAYISCKANLDEENFKKHPQHPLAKGGPFYELAQHLPFNVTPRDFDNANWR